MLDACPIWSCSKWPYLSWVCPYSWNVIASNPVWTQIFFFVLRHWNDAACWCSSLSSLLASRRPGARKGGCIRTLVITRITCFLDAEIQCSSARLIGIPCNLKLRMVTRSSGCECLTSPIYFTSQTPRTEWVLKWPGQIVIAGCQTHWTKEVSEALVENKINELYKALMAQVPTTVVESQTKSSFHTSNKGGAGGGGGWGGQGVKTSRAHDLFLWIPLLSSCKKSQLSEIFTWVVTPYDCVHSMKSRTSDRSKGWSRCAVLLKAGFHWSES